jgi:hypothetical protein
MTAYRVETKDHSWERRYPSSVRARLIPIATGLTSRAVLSLAAIEPQGSRLLDGDVEGREDGRVDADGDEASVDSDGGRAVHERAAGGRER